MDQKERRTELIRMLLAESPRYAGIGIPDDETEQRRLLRSLMNVRPPEPVGADFLRIQDAYLRRETEAKGITNIDDLEPVRDDLCLWRGDITTLRCGSIVNAANSGMLGCFQPCHSCIDNVIHTYAGVQLRLACYDIMRRQGHEEGTGLAKVTPAFNLPCDHVIHTVGPIVEGRLTDRHREQLASCYRSCLDAARSVGDDSIAFCCISTGVFRFPPEEAARIAVDTVEEWVKENDSGMRIVFDVFRGEDHDIYSRLLARAAEAQKGYRGGRLRRRRSGSRTIDRRGVRLLRR